MYTRDDYEKAVTLIQSRTSLKPEIGLVLGSGLGRLADELTDSVKIPYEDIPGFPRSTVAGHSGQLVIGTLEGQTVICQQGRAHFYEGYTPEQVTFAIRVMHFLGVKTVILTNAAGGINSGFKAGDVMLINDHLYLLGIVGNNPLMGPNDESIGPRFPGMSQAYDRQLRELAHEVARENDIMLRDGVYAALSGPTYETPAEVRFLRLIGADAVGMSTAPEVVVARHAGMRVLAFSAITNVAIDAIDTDTDANHDEVMEMGLVIVPKLITLLKGVLKRL